MTLKALLVALGLLPLWKEDRPLSPEKERQLSSISAAVHAAAKTPDEAAFLVAWGQAESAFSLRIHAGLCKPHECDRGRARGPWQGHRNGLAVADWDRMHGVEHVQFQADEAARRSRWALRACRGEPDPVRGAFAVLGGRGCKGSIPGIDERVATFRRVRSRL